MHKKWFDVLVDSPRIETMHHLLLTGFKNRPITEHSVMRWAVSYLSDFLQHIAERVEHCDDEPVWKNVRLKIPVEKE